MPCLMLLMMHQPHLHQPWRLDRCMYCSLTHVLLWTPELVRHAMNIYTQVDGTELPRAGVTITLRSEKQSPQLPVAMQSISITEHHVPRPYFKARWLFLEVCAHAAQGNCST